ncbi:MAG: hypothetical protein HC804_01785 [Anaerolineae bacterium]|nr:hypothetical protein [Anaerolineae bacterium]
MKRQVDCLTAVTLLLLLVLAACGGGTNEQEATGSESVGDILPTPITGAKVLPTRLNTAALMPDILIVAPARMLTAVELTALDSQLTLPNARFALVLAGDAESARVVDFVIDMGELTAVDEQTNATSTLSLSGALAEGLELSGWRPNSTPRLILLLVGEGMLPDEEILALAETAVSQNIRLYILQSAEVAEWAEVAEVGDGRVLLLPNIQEPGDLGLALTTFVTDVLSETSP